jgi:alpha-2-macroglobulin
MSGGEVVSEVVRHSLTYRSRAMRFGRIVLGMVLAGGLAVLVAAENEKPARPKPEVTSVPHLPDPINAALQDREFDKAVGLLDEQLAVPKVAHPDYLLYMKGRALAEAGKSDEALAVYEGLEKAHPQSAWLSRSRFGRGAVHARARRFELAATIYRAETERLLSNQRTDELTGIYLEFADRFFDGVPVAGPTTERKPDFAQALGYYQQALQLQPSQELRRKTELRVARCHLELNQHGEAIAAYQVFLKTWCEARVAAERRATSVQEAEARYQLGRVQLAAGQPAEARKTWQDFLASDVAKAGAGEMPAEATYRLAHTYGMPQPPTVGDLELGVAQLLRFVQEFPKHALAPQAELEIARGYVHHGRHEQAVARLREMIANEAYAEKPQVTAAWNLLGQVYATQKKFDEAIATWRTFLEKYPTDPLWSEVQRVIVDTEFAAAEDQRGAGGFDAARKLWETFLNKYPLDPRAALVLYRFGEMHHEAAVRLAEPLPPEGDEPPTKADPAGAEKLFEAAIADWRRLVSKYPGTNEASQGAFMIGQTLEHKLVRLADALEAYKKVEGAFQGQSQAAIAQLTSKQLEVVTERKFRGQEKAVVRLTTRNLESVSVKTYRIDMTDYFRKMHLGGGVESLDIALIDPDKSWEHKVENFASYRRVQETVEIPVEGPGVTAVTISGDTLEATTMVVVGDIDLVVKCSRNELFVFAEDMVAGKPAEGVTLLVSDGGKVFAEVKTGKEGVYQGSFEELKNVNDLRVFAVRDGHSASSQADLQGLQFAVGLAPKGYLHTDRPAYRAGQLVNIKGIVRWVEADRYVVKPGEKFLLQVIDSRNRVLHSQDVVTGDFGTLSANFSLPTESPQGSYRVHLRQAARNQSFETTFEVHEYRLEPVRFTVDLPRKVYYRGEQVQGKLVLKYYHGTPLAGRTVEYRLGDDRWYTAETDANGEVAFDLPTRRYSESQALGLVARCAERNLTTGAVIQLATRGFEVSLSTARSVYVAGETFDATTLVADAAGKPLAQALKLEVLRITNVQGRTGERLVETHDIQTDEKAGRVKHTLRLEKAGQYALRATGTDRFGNTVSGSASVTISGEKDSVRLRILSDKHSYKTGETAKVQLHWREKPALALVTYEGASILGYRMLELKPGANPLDVTMDEKLAPNFQLSVTVMEGNRFHTAQSEFVVARGLNIALKPSAATLRPGEPLTVELLVTDAQGKPVSAEVSLGLVQQNLLDQFPDGTESIEAFFNGGSRTVSVRAFSSCTFKYEPATRPINEFLLAETRREEDRLRELDALKAASAPLPAPAPAAAAEAMDDAPATPPGEPGVAAFGGLGGGMGAPDTARMGRYAKPQGAAKADRQQKMMRDKDGMEDQPEDETLMLQYDSDFAEKSMLGKADAQLLGLRLRKENSWHSYFMDTRELGNTTKGFEMLAITDNTVVALNGRGEFQVVNGFAVVDLERIAADGGLQVLPGMASAETGYWNPGILTDAEGKGTVVFRTPDRSTAWKLRAKGINVETLAGQTEADIVTQKELFGELQTPLAYTEGDKGVVLVEVHNTAFKEGEIVVSLKTTIGEVSTEQKKTLKVEKIGVESHSFPVTVASGDGVLFELTVARGESRDVLTRTVPVLPYGLPVMATAAGVTAQSTSFTVDFAPDQPAVQPELELVIGPTVRRTLIDAVLGGDGGAWDRSLPRPSNEIERAVSDVLGGVALLKMIGASRDADTPDARELAARVQSGLSRLVAAQRDDGGWSWSSGAGADRVDRYLTSRAMWGLSLGRKGGFAVPEETFVKGSRHLATLLAGLAENDHEARAILLHGLAEADSADFAVANRLHRSRNQLSASGLVHTALALVRMDRRDMAAELLELAKPKIPSAPAKVGRDAALAGCLPWMQTGVELRALYLAALNELDPKGKTAAPLADWLMSARIGSRWRPEKANGPALLALADWFGRTQFAEEKYTLTIRVNDKEVETFTVEPANVPARTVKVPAKLLAAKGPQRVSIDMVGRGRISYSAVLSGFVPAEKLKSTTNDWYVERWYEPAQRLLDGEAIPRGFDILTGQYTTFLNPVTQLPMGERAEVTVMIHRTRLTGQPNEPLDYLVVTEPIPAGTSVLPDSITGPFDRYEIGAGAITFYLGDRAGLGQIQYALTGYVPGAYRTAPTLSRSFYEPDRIVVSKTKDLTILAQGAKSTDEYRSTPRELFELGKRLAAKGEHAAAAKHLTELFTKHRLNDDAYRQTVSLLFECALVADDAENIVRYFEIVKEKYADIEVSFDRILKVGKAYARLGEHERSYLVYRATAEAGFQRESQIVGFLDQRGEFLRSVQVMERLLREYPAESYVAIAAYALSQEVYGKAPEAAANETLRNAGLTRIDLIAASARMLDAFLSTWPNDPAADQAGFAMATALLDMGQFEKSAQRAAEFAKRYPNSQLLDSFWYIIGFSRFAQGRHDDALETVKKVAEFVRKDPQTGAETPAAGKWQAIYIMGQIYHSLGKPASAVEEYTKVKDRFPDANEAIDFFTRKDLTLPEVTVVKPGDACKIALKHRNVAEANVKAYRIDLLKFSLLQRNLSRITAINLAGIRPYHDLPLNLGDGKDYRDRERDLDLPLKDEGAYLVVCQGENLYTSGLVLVSPLVLEVQEDVPSGRVRVTVKDQVADKYVVDVHVKAIGTRNPKFVSGQTDLRGVFVADGIEGECTVIARVEPNRYAFHRGKVSLGAPPASATPMPQLQEEAKKRVDVQEQLLEQIRGTNNEFNSLQRGNYRQLLDNKQQGVAPNAAF